MSDDEPEDEDFLPVALAAALFFLSLPDDPEDEADE